MPVKLIGLDIDGTLLNSRKQLTPRTRESIEAAARAGIRVAYLTGRPLAGTEGPIRLSAVSHIVASNGATTHELASGSLLRGRYIPKEAAKAIAATATPLAASAGMNRPRSGAPVWASWVTAPLEDTI